MSIQAIKVCCQGCGADLQFADGIRFLTCNFCGSRLEIVREATTTHSRLLDELHRKTDRMEGKLRLLELQNELELLDRNWDRYRESCLTRDPQGGFIEPNLAGSQVLGYGALTLGGVILLFCLANLNTTNGAQSLFFVIILAGFGIHQLRSSSEKARSFNGAKISYQLRRSTLIRSIQELRKGS